MHNNYFRLPLLFAQLQLIPCKEFFSSLPPFLALYLILNTVWSLTQISSAKFKTYLWNFQNPLLFCVICLLWGHIMQSPLHNSSSCPYVWAQLENNVNINGLLSFLSKSKSCRTLRIWHLSFICFWGMIAICSWGSHNKKIESLFLPFAVK